MLVFCIGLTGYEHEIYNGCVCCQPVFGCGGAEPVKYRHVADGGGDLHFVDDTEVDLAGVASDPQPTPARGITTLHGESPLTPTNPLVCVTEFHHHIRPGHHNKMDSVVSTMIIIFSIL